MTFTAKSVMAVEKEADKPIYELIADVSVKTLMLLVKAGLNVNEESALTYIDEKIKEEGMMGLYVSLLETLKVQGFLPKSLNLEEVKQKLMNA